MIIENIIDERVGEKQKSQGSAFGIRRLDE